MKSVPGEISNGKFQIFHLYSTQSAYFSSQDLEEYSPLSEAVALLARSGEVGPLEDGDLGREHEQWLTSHTGGAPVAVTDWPRAIKPFYMRSAASDPSLVAGVDLLVPGVGELAGGSLRYNVCL